MNKILLLLFAYLIFSCKKESNNTVDITGVWVGTYSHDYSNGTFKANIIQNEGVFNGSLTVKDGENYNLFSNEIKGTISNDVLSSNIFYGYVKINVKSQNLENSAANGVFSTNVAIDGTWEGIKIPSANAVLTEVFSKKSTLLKSCVVVNGQFWLSDYFSNKIYKIDTLGNVKGEVELGMNYQSFCYDGQYLWFSDFSEGVSYADTMGNILGNKKLPGITDGNISFCNNSIWYFNERSRLLYKLDKQFIKLDSTAIEYFDFGQLDHYDGDYYFFDSGLNSIIKVNESFKNPSVYTLKHDGHFSGKQMFVNGKLWFVANVNYSNSVVPISSEGEVVRFYKVTY